MAKKRAQTDKKTELMNSTEHIFLEICSNKRDSVKKTYCCRYRLISIFQNVGQNSVSKASPMFEKKNSIGIS
jgi:hypothetical protein